MKEISPVVGIAQKACPAVITIIISKDLPKVEGFFLLPFGGQEFIMPNMKGEKEKTTGDRKLSMANHGLI